MRDHSSSEMTKKAYATVNLNHTVREHILFQDEIEVAPDKASDWVDACSRSDEEVEQEFLARTRIQLSNGGYYYLIDFARKVHKYQYLFYSLSDKIHEDLLKRYEWLASEEFFENNWEEAFENTSHCIDYVFTHNPHKPKESTLAELNGFYEYVKAMIDVFSVVTPDSLVGICRDFIRDNQNRIRHKNNPEDIFDDWDKSLRAYQWHLEGKPYEEIYDLLETAAVSSKYHKVYQRICEVERLISAAEKGTFPYTR